MAHPAVAETAVVGYPHNLKGEGLFAFVILKESVPVNPHELIVHLKAAVRKMICGFAVPDRILVGNVVTSTVNGPRQRQNSS